MNPVIRNKSDSLIYERLAECQMTDLERLVAMNALRDADAFVDSLMWVAGKIEQLGNLLLKPSLKA